MVIVSPLSRVIPLTNGMILQAFPGHYLDSAWFGAAGYRSVWVKNAAAKWKSNWPYKHLEVVGFDDFKVRENMVK